MIIKYYHKVNIVFLYLRSFSKTGGIEKFNRLFMMALRKIAESNAVFNPKFISAYDASNDQKYTGKIPFIGFRESRFFFTIYAVFEGIFKQDMVILGHINLAPIGFIIKLLGSKKKVILIVHGIDVWQKQKLLKKWILFHADIILTVSEYTKQRILENHKIDASKFVVFPNTIDPFYEIPQTYSKTEELLLRYNLDHNSKILLTVSRLEKTEKYKGYDLILEAIPKIIEIYPNLQYLIVGKGDEVEVERITQQIKKYKIENYVKLIGYVNDNELIEHYQLADLFVMPSKKEGFGIVFIEAVLCGLNVIAGNIDGSKEALLNGEIGVLVNPDSVEEIKEAILKALAQPHTTLQKELNKEKVLHHFGFQAFATRLENILKN